METNISKLQYKSGGFAQNNLRIHKGTEKLFSALFFLLFAILWNTGFAQKTEVLHNLTKEQLVLFGKTAQNKISELESSIAIIADKSLPNYRRDKAIKSAQQLFIAGAKMEVSTLLPDQSIRKKTFEISAYFYRLKRLKYKQVTIKFYDLFYLDEFLLGTDGRYHATATIYQEFKGVTAEGVVYTDKTEKTIDIVLEYTEDKFFKTHRWMVRLGDIKVQDTKA